MKGNATITYLTKTINSLWKGNIHTPDKIIDKISKEYALTDDDTSFIYDYVQTLTDKELKRFTKYNRGIMRAVDVDDFTDKIKMAENFIKCQPFFYTSEKIWWLWSFQKKMWTMVDEIDIMNWLDDAIQRRMNTTSTGIRTEIVEALKRVGRKHIPKPIKYTWVQFNDRIVDVSTGKEFEPSPEYWVTNPIPYSLGDSDETPTLDKIFSEWVVGGDQDKTWVKTLYEIVAFCLLPKYILARIFWFTGSGSNGKSKFLNLIHKFLGANNICSTDLDILIRSPFESSSLYKKLVCMMGETSFGIMDDTSQIKRLTGEDPIRVEFKHKIKFEDFNYAKILIATNSIPDSSDKSIGYGRRHLVIDFPNTFSEAIDIMSTIPEEEYSNLARKCVRILEELIRRRSFTNEGTAEQRKKRYEDFSNPVRPFINENFILDPEGTVPLWKFKELLRTYLIQRRKRILSNVEVSKKVADEGLQLDKQHFDKYVDGELKRSTQYVILGISFKDASLKGGDAKKMDTLDTQDTQSSLNSIYSKLTESNVSNVSNISKNDVDNNISVVTNKELLDKINEKFVMFGGKVPVAELEMIASKDVINSLLSSGKIYSINSGSLYCKGVE